MLNGLQCISLPINRILYLSKTSKKTIIKFFLTRDFDL